MYVVRNKKNQRFIQVNFTTPEPSQNGKSNSFEFDPETMEIIPINIRELIAYLRLYEDERNPNGTLSAYSSHSGQTHNLNISSSLNREAPQISSLNDSMDAFFNRNITMEIFLEEQLQRLRQEVRQYYIRHRTPGGCQLDELCRQKASFSYLFRELPETHPKKQKLLKQQLIYPDSLLDEILESIENVQNAYKKAKTAMKKAFSQAEPMAELENITLFSYL